MRNKKAISLIVLVITIIVMIILASAIIMSLDNTNIFNKAEEAVNKTNAATEKYVDEIKLAERKLENMSEAVKVTDNNPGTLSGEGTEKNPYLIESIEDLVAFSEAVNGGNTYEGKTVKLARKLDFNSDNSYANPKSGLKEQMTTGSGFMPIGSYEIPFKGTFDGDYYELQNLYINLTADEIVDIGLFGGINNATVKNIGITGNITVGSTKNDAYVGGVIGAMEASCKLINCYNKATIRVETGGYAGGVVGLGQILGENNTSIMYNCFNEGEIIGSSDYIGGIGGSVWKTQVDRCYNEGILEGLDFSTYCNMFIAGLFADFGGANSYIKNSYNAGEIKGTYFYGAGLVEMLQSSIIENAYNAGNIVCKTPPGSVAAGIVLEGETRINNLFNIGSINGYGVQSEIASYFDGTIENIYCTNTNASVSEGEYTGVPTIKTLEYMKSQAFVDELNSNIQGRDDLVKWKMGPKGYPVLDI